MGIVLSKNKIAELKHELKQTKTRLVERNAEHNSGGGANESPTETAAFRAIQRTIERRVQELEVILKSAKVLEDKVDSQYATMGSYVEIQDVIVEKSIQKYRLVHPIESDPSKGLLSVESPLGKSLLGAKNGALITFRDRDFYIISVT